MELDKKDANISVRLIGLEFNVLILVIVDLQSKESD